MINIYNNEIPLNVCNQLYEILSTFYNNNCIKDEKYEKWYKTITTTPTYTILTYSKDNKIVGFICYMYTNKGLMLSEIQIKKECQGKYDILRTMLKNVLNNIDKEKSKMIYATIKDSNIKSKQVFTHIGFIKDKDITYKISFNDLNKWINKKAM